MNIVIDTAGYGTSHGSADQITLLNGKYCFTNLGSILSLIAGKKGLERKKVEYFGACMTSTINERAHLGFPIQIDEIPVCAFLEKIASEKDCEEFIAQICNDPLLCYI